MRGVQDRATRTNMARLAVILEGIVELEEIVRDGLEEFTRDETLPYAASHKLGQISYSSGRVSREIRQANPQVPWRHLRRISPDCPTVPGTRIFWWMARSESSGIPSLSYHCSTADRPSKWPGFDGRVSRVYGTR